MLKDFEQEWNSTVTSFAPGTSSALGATNPSYVSSL